MLRIHELLKVIDMGDGNFNYQQTIAMLTYKYIKLSEQRGRASLNIAMFGLMSLRVQCKELTYIVDSTQLTDRKKAREINIQ